MLTASAAFSRISSLCTRSFRCIRGEPRAHSGLKPCQQRIGGLCFSSALSPQRRRPTRSLAARGGAVPKHKQGRKKKLPSARSRHPFHESGSGAVTFRQAVGLRRPKAAAGRQAPPPDGHALQGSLPLSTATAVAAFLWREPFIYLLRTCCACSFLETAAPAGYSLRSCDR